MKLTKSQVQHISDLARLDLSDAEIAKFQKQLSSILEYADLLNEIDTANVEPTAQTTGLKNIYHEDKQVEEQGLTQEEVLANAPQKQKGFIKTAAVLP
jgi:aspartyl-tRNA(Asn)/glutamyl-tRNA(Gln) amidotransferase subunit C